MLARISFVSASPSGAAAARIARGGAFVVLKSRNRAGSALREAPPLNQASRSARVCAPASRARGAFEEARMRAARGGALPGSTFRDTHSPTFFMNSWKSASFPISPRWLSGTSRNPDSQAKKIGYAFAPE